MILAVDRPSLLVHVPAATTLAALEQELVGHGLTLDLPAVDARPLDRWLAEGAPGAPSAFLDPPDHLVAGITFTTHNGHRVVLPPCPRRSVGPDLVALVVAARGRFAVLESVWLRVFDRPRQRPAPLPFHDDPPTDAAEARWVDALAAEFAG